MSDKTPEPKAPDQRIPLAEEMLRNLESKTGGIPPALRPLYGAPSDPWEYTKIPPDVISIGPVVDSPASLSTPSVKQQPLPKPEEIAPKPAKKTSHPFLEAWDDVRSVGKSFVFCLAFLGAAIVGFVNWVYIERIETLKTTIESQKDEIVRLTPGSSAELAKQNEALKKQVTELLDRDAKRSAREWPAMTRDQMKQWVEKLKTLDVARVEIFYDKSDGTDLYNSFKEIGRMSQIDIRAGTGLTGGDLQGLRYNIPPNYGNAAPILDELLGSLGPTTRLRVDGELPQTQLSITLEIGDKLLTRP